MKFNATSVFLRLSHQNMQPQKVSKLNRVKSLNDVTILCLIIPYLPSLVISFRCLVLFRFFFDFLRRVITCRCASPKPNASTSWDRGGLVTDFVQRRVRCILGRAKLVICCRNSCSEINMSGDINHNIKKLYNNMFSRKETLCFVSDDGEFSFLIKVSCVG